MSCSKQPKTEIVLALPTERAELAELLSLVNHPPTRSEKQRTIRFKLSDMVTPVPLAAAAVDPNIPTAEDLMEKEVIEELDLIETEPAENGGGVVFSIIVKSYHPGDAGEMYRIGSQETFADIYRDYSSRVDVNPVQIKLYHGNTYVASNAYPAQVGVETGSVLYVEGLEGVVNTNTRIKRFYLKNSGHRKKIKLRVQGKLDIPLCRLFHVWGDKFGVDPANLAFYHENISLCPLHTIREAGILNGDKVVVVPNMHDMHVYYVLSIFEEIMERSWFMLNTVH